MDYEALNNQIRQMSYKAAADVLTKELPSSWMEEYRKNTPNVELVLHIEKGSFEYLFDHAQAHAEVRDSRVIAVLGRSRPPTVRRERSRLRGWVGATEQYFGRDYDKGHFIAHSMGGLVDTWEINIFPQLRRVNRGWSTEGKLFRAMEGYCASNPNTFCFFHSIYNDLTIRPAKYEYGYLHADGKLWIEEFENQ